MCSIPDVTVIDPCDAVELRQVVKVAAETPGTFYIRNLRQGAGSARESTYQFEVGKATVLREGSDVGIVGTGFMTAGASAAADRAAAAGVSCAVLHVPSLKPFDTASVVEFAAGVERIVTAENHLRARGLGSLVLETLYERGLS